MGHFVIVGKKKVDYFSVKRGKQVVGVEFYLNSIDTIPNGEGFSCLKPIYFSNNKLDYSDFNVGDVVTVYYNQYGNIEKFELV